MPKMNEPNVILVALHMADDSIQDVDFFAQYMNDKYNTEEVEAMWVTGEYARSVFKNVPE